MPGNCLPDWSPLATAHKPPPKLSTYYKSQVYLYIMWLRSDAWLFWLQWWETDGLMVFMAVERVQAIQQDISPGRFICPLLPFLGNALSFAEKLKGNLHTALHWLHGISPCVFIAAREPLGISPTDPPHSAISLQRLTLFLCLPWDSLWLDLHCLSCLRCPLAPDLASLLLLPPRAAGKERKWCRFHSGKHADHSILRLTSSITGSSSRIKSWLSRENWNTSAAIGSLTKGYYALFTSPRRLAQLLLWECLGHVPIIAPTPVPHPFLVICYFRQKHLFFCACPVSAHKKKSTGECWGERRVCGVSSWLLPEG